MNPDPAPQINADPDQEQKPKAPVNTIRNYKYRIRDT